MLTLRTMPSTNEKNGNGKYRPLRNRKRRIVKGSPEQNFKYLVNNDLTMRFSNSKDPIYYVFDCLDKRTLPQLLGDFVEDYLGGAINFVSKAVRQ